MQQKQDTDATLKAIRDLMYRNTPKIDNDVLELTEDDLLDEHDEDAYCVDRIAKKEDNFINLNEILTQVSDSNSVAQGKSSAEDAARSIETLKSLIKKASQPMDYNSSFKKKATLEDLFIDALKPVLNEWIEKNLPSMVQKIVEQEVQKLITTQDRKR